MRNHFRGQVIAATLLAACSADPVDGGVDVSTPDDVSSEADMGRFSDAGDCGAPGNAVTVDDDRGQFTVEPFSRSDCSIGYRIASTAARRDDEPASPREVSELAGWPRLRTGNAVLDGLYAMTLEEVRENSVDAISDGAFNGGEPLACPDGGCFETGALWHYVWTRDISYAVDLGLAGVDTQRARNSLMLKVSARRDGTDTQVMQDTGTGGSYPVSTDRVVWALGARAVLAQLPDDERNEFAGQMFEALRNTLVHDRAVAFDADTGLYFGEQSFLDWREQTYPAWVAPEPVHIATSRSLSTNVLHLRAIETLIELAAMLGREAEVADWGGRADELRGRIRDTFWNSDRGQFSSFLATQLDTAPSPQLDLLGSSHAVLAGLTSDDEASAVLSNYPHFGVGAPVIFPQQQLTRIYHNRAEWPFVSAYWLRAAGETGNDEVASAMMETLLRGAGLNLSNMENWEISSGAPWVDDGDYSGPVVNSRRQLWSVAGFVSMIHQSLFGLQPDLAPDPVLRVAPRIPAQFRAVYLGEQTELRLEDYQYRGMSITVVIQLPTEAGSGFYEVADVTVDGAPAGALIDAAALSNTSTVEVRMAPGRSTSTMTTVSDTDWRVVFAPRPPRIDAIDVVGDALRLSLATDDTETVTWNIYRDGVRVADAITGQTWTDPTWDATSPATPCYVAQTCFDSSGNCSHHSAPVCFWGAGGERIAIYPASQLANIGGELSDDHGRTHWSVWGDEGHRLTLSGVQPATSGEHLIQVAYGNGAGDTTTGITCGVKHVGVYDEADDSLVAEGIAVMPHLGSWDVWGLSSFVGAELTTGRSYRIVLASEGPFAINMSQFEHFATYAGEGGASPFNRVNVAEIRVLAR